MLPSLIKINTYPPKSIFKREYPHGKEQLDLISPCFYHPCSATREATAVKSPCIAIGE